jgi:hypothetical protein
MNPMEDCRRLIFHLRNSSKALNNIHILHATCFVTWCPEPSISLGLTMILHGCSLRLPSCLGAIIHFWLPLLMIELGTDWVKAWLHSQFERETSWVDTLQKTTLFDTLLTTKFHILCKRKVKARHALSFNQREQ